MTAQASGAGWRARAKTALTTAARRARGAPATLVRLIDRLVEVRNPVWAPPYPTVGVGIVTYNRPRFFEQVIAGALEHLAPIATLHVYNDGSSPNEAYREIFSRLPPSVHVVDAPQNLGVAKAKNALLRAMMGFDYLFLLEDDIVPLSSAVVVEYVKASRRSGLEHLSFAHHGPANAGGRVGVSGWVEYYPNAIGAWCMYTRRSLERVGLFDENFRNAWEHCEHTHRLALAGFTSPFWRFADVRGSKQWFREIPQALESSTIRTNPSWTKNMRDGLLYWSKKDPEHFPLRDMLASMPPG